VEKFKYLVFVFKRDGKQNEELDMRMEKVGTVMPTFQYSAAKRIVEKITFGF